VAEKSIAAAINKHPSDKEESLRAILLHRTNRGVEPEGDLRATMVSQVVSRFFIIEDFVRTR
jgi:hypothetical protein